MQDNLHALISKQDHTQKTQSKPVRVNLIWISLQQTYFLHNPTKEATLNAGAV